MIIRSSFRDYYDVIAKMGVDRSIVYNRETRTLDYEVPRIGDYRGEHTMILFCRKIYPYVQFETKVSVKKYNIDLDKYITSLETKWVNCYSLDEVDAFKKETLSARSYTRFYVGKNHDWRVPNRRKYAERFEPSFVEHARQALCKLADEHGAPIAHYSSYSRRVILNACLKGFGFYRKVDSYTAYQEVFQYMASLAQPEKETPYVSDADLQACKGFDAPWAFRKTRKTS